MYLKQESAGAERFAGNHAQGVAYSARKLKIPATIVMPEGTPAIKYLNVARLGGDVKLFGDDFDAAKAKAHELELEHGLTNIPPFDDPYVIAGQGTIGLELMTQTPLRKLEAVFCCVGGGGLIAGVGVFLKRVAPHIKIIGVEAIDASAMAQSLEVGERITLNEVGLFADGAAVKIVGEETFRLCREVVDDIIQVTTDEICAAIKDFFDETRSVVEPAGALALAGLKKYVALHPSDSQLGQNSARDRGLVAIASGANMNFDRLRFVAERAGLGENREALLRVVIPEQAQSFARLVEVVLPRPITEFSYRYNKGRPAHILMGISVRPADREADLAALFAELEKNGMAAEDRSDDELAKSLARYHGGGRSSVANERLYMFEFPERPNALAKFLRTLRPEQNVTLFYYRNTGGDVSKVFAGIECPDEVKGELEGFLRQLKYPFKDCTDSVTYQEFLRES